ncbi:hypothetical protein ACFQ9X_03615 [Catenulispora yoronensis]
MKGAAIMGGAYCPAAAGVFADSNGLSGGHGWSWWQARGWRSGVRGSRHHRDHPDPAHHLRFAGRQRRERHRPDGRGLGGWLATWFKDLFTPDSPKLNVFLNYGLATLVYLAVGGILRRVLNDALA